MIGNVNEEVRKYLLKPNLEVKKDFLLPKALKTVFLKQKSLCDTVASPPGPAHVT
jgi:hypothetical protein